MRFNASQLQKILDENVNDYGANKLIEFVFNSLMKLERQAFMAENKSSNNKGNGYRSRCFSSLSGKIQFKIPRDRFGQFYPFILEILKKQEQEIRELAFQLYAKGLSTRDIENVFANVFGTNYKKSTISNISQEFKELLTNWRNRPLEKNYPIIMIDAIHSKLRRLDSVETEAFCVVVGVREDKSRDILALENIPTESAAGWEFLFNRLKSRGLQTTKLVVADGLAGLENVVSKVFENAKFQKCVTHFKRSLLAKVRNSDKSEISDDLKEIFCVEQERYTKEIALKNLDNFAKKWGDKYRFIRNLSNREDVVYYFTFLEFDHRIQRLIYTTNWIENLNKQFRKVLKIRNSMPSDESVLLLLSKVAMDKVDKYLNYPIYQFKFDKILFPES